MTLVPGMQAMGCANVDWARLEAKVAINDHNNARGATGSKMTFQVLADRKIIWSSDPVSKTGIIQALSVNITAVKKLTLQVVAAGSNACSHSVFLDPKIFGAGW